MNKKTAIAVLVIIAVILAVAGLILAFGLLDISQNQPQNTPTPTQQPPLLGEAGPQGTPGPTGNLGGAGGNGGTGGEVIGQGVSAKDVSVH